MQSDEYRKVMAYINMLVSKINSGKLDKDAVISLSELASLVESDASQSLYPAETESLNPQFTYDVNLEKVFGANPLTEDDKLKTKTYGGFRTITGKLNAVGQELSIDCRDMQTVAVQPSGVFGTSTYIIEGTLNNSSWSAIPVFNPANANAIASVQVTVSANSIVIGNVAGYLRVRVRVVAIASGSITCTINLSPHSPRVFSYAYGTQNLPLYQTNTINTQYTTTTNNLNTIDWIIAMSRRPGFAEIEQPVVPTNITQPTTYPKNLAMRIPQIRPRIGVEIAGDKKQSFAQEENTLELKTIDDTQRRLLEGIYLQLALQNQLLCQINNISLPNGFEEIR